MSNGVGFSRGNYLTFIPKSADVEVRLKRVLADAENLKILLRTAKELEATQKEQAKQRGGSSHG